MRTLMQHHLALGLLLALPLSADVLPAQGFPALTFELKEGSLLVDDCFCDRLPIEVPIRGKLVLRRLPVRLLGELYDIEEVQIQSVSSGIVDAGYTITGKGSLYRRASDPDVQTLSLVVTVNDVANIELKADAIEAQAKWPRLDLSADESRDPARDPFHIYSLRIVAEPVAATWRYEVIEGSRENFEGSFFYDDCDICGRPTIPLPVKGAFLLTQALGDEANPIQKFTIDQLSMRTTDENFPFEISGGGSFEQGGEVALLQSMDLLVAVNKETAIELSSGKVTVPEGVQFPEIRLRLEQTNAPTPVHVFRLDLWARPASGLPAVEFRRGDANGDGAGDISDAVFVLLWRFAGGVAPGCLEAADVNADSQHDLSDAVYLLLHLFQGGPAPPVPGLAACGVSEPAVFGCDVSVCP